MKRATLLLALGAVVLVALPAVGVAAVSDSTPSQTEEASTNETAPGEQFSGVVGVGQAELEGDLDQRRFGRQVAQAATPEAKADAVATQVDDLERRLDTLEQRKATLDAQREAGEISDGKYRAQVAKLAAEIQTTRQLSNQSAQAADGLPAEVRNTRNIDTAKMQTLQNRANGLSGPEISEIARGVAGPNVGNGPPVDVPGQPDDDQSRGGGPSEGTPGNDQRASSGQNADSDQPGERGGPDTG